MTISKGHIEPYRINVREVFKNKSPRVARLIPGFIFRVIERIIHQDEMNQFLDVHGHKVNLDFIDAVIHDFNVSFDIRGEKHIPRDGRFIFVSNHPLGGFDGMILMNVVKKHFKDFKFIVNDILLNIKNIEDLFIPVNKHGRQSRENARIIESYYASDAQLLTFPSGLVSRRKKGLIRDLEWKKNFISKAINYERDIIPVHISGQNTNRFYNLSNFRKFMGIKTNIEMFLLADETYRHKNKKFTITIGKPISYKGFSKDKTHDEWAQMLKDHVYSLTGDENILFGS